MSQRREGEEVSETLQQVWKFPLPVRDDGSADVEMPADARVLHVGMQGKTICLWAIVSPDAEKVVRQFRVVGTGWPMAKVGRHLGTVITGSYVWHVFAAWEPQPQSVPFVEDAA